MTRKLLVLPVLALALALPRVAAADDSLQRVLDAGVLRIGAEPNTPPMLFKSGARYDGFDWAVANALAKRIGVDTVVVVPGKYSELPGRLIADKFDVIVSGYTADPSIPGVDWSEPYYDYGLCLVVRKGSGIRSVDDLVGRTVGLFNDPAAEQDVRGASSAGRAGPSATPAISEDQPPAPKELPGLKAQGRVGPRRTGATSTKPG